MNSLTLIVGKPGNGKTTSFRNLGKGTVVFNTERKQLPFRNNGIKNIAVDSIEDFFPNPGQQGWKKDGWLISAAKNPDIKVIIIDSLSQFIEALMYDCNKKYKGFEQWNKLNDRIFELFEILKNITGKHVILTGHPETITHEDGTYDVSMAIAGKNKGMLEKHAVCVFYATTVKKSEGKGVEYKFVTNTDGTLPAKSPMDMFEELYIDNDLEKILKTYDEFWGFEYDKDVAKEPNRNSGNTEKDREAA